MGLPRNRGKYIGISRGRERGRCSLAMGEVRWGEIEKREKEGKEGARTFVFSSLFSLLVLSLHILLPFLRQKENRFGWAILFPSAIYAAGINRGLIGVLWVARAFWILRRRVMRVTTLAGEKVGRMDSGAWSVVCVTHVHAQCFKRVTVCVATFSSVTETLF